MKKTRNNNTEWEKNFRNYQKDSLKVVIYCLSQNKILPANIFKVFTKDLGNMMVYYKTPNYLIQINLENNLGNPINVASAILFPNQILGSRIIIEGIYLEKGNQFPELAKKQTQINSKPKIEDLKPPKKNQQDNSARTEFINLLQAGCQLRSSKDSMIPIGSTLVATMRITTLDDIRRFDKQFRMQKDHFERLLKHRDDLSYDLTERHINDLDSVIRPYKDMINKLYNIITDMAADKYSSLTDKLAEATNIATKALDGNMENGGKLIVKKSSM